MNNGELSCIELNPECSIYRVTLPEVENITCLIVSTPGTRAICNDPLVLGIEYTSHLRESCASALRSLRKHRLIDFSEDNTTVLNILRGGLNFGLREALSSAFSWNRHASAFISAQRVRKDPASEDWIITESDYKKVHLRKKNNIVFGDVVATGTSLEFALKRMADFVRPGSSEIESLLFFTIGSARSYQILSKVSQQLRKDSGSFRSATVVFFEGIFLTASNNTHLSIQIDGTDLLRTNSILAPEFITSQYDNPSYPIERCTIYDAGSRAFDIEEYLGDVKDYWEKTLDLARKQLNYQSLLIERFPELETKTFSKVNLVDLCEKQIRAIDSILG